MDSARCRCPHDSKGVRCGRNHLCPIHGSAPLDPAVPYVLGSLDRAFLRRLRIDAEDAAAIEAVRQAEEDRFKNRPRLEP